VLKSLSHLLALQQLTVSEFMVLSQALVAEEQLSLVTTEPKILQASLPEDHVYTQYEMQAQSSCFEGLPHSQKGSGLW